MSATTIFALSYDEYGAWYDAYRTNVLEPALDRASAELDRELVDVLSDRDLSRLRNATGRVKSKRRTWRKVRQPRYAGRVNSPADIPSVVDDLVGLRITCTNLRDIEMVETALETVPRSPDGGRLWIDAATERDYVVEPKESGYRGWHVNLNVSVEVDGVEVPVTCELQVRTLLQDSWGELTHEDTYSKDGALPPLVEVLSKRMADLFATLDDIAEDLRSELDRIDEAVVARSSDEASNSDQAASDEPILSEQGADATTFLIERWENLDRPTDLAVLAWALQTEFGAEISDEWFGHRTFKRFITHALPESEITTGRQAFLLPAGFADDLPDGSDAKETDEPVGDEHTSDGSINDDSISDDSIDDDEEDQNGAAIPDAALVLRRVDRAFPLLDTEQWNVLYEEVAESWRRTGATVQSAAVISRIARSTRDRSEAKGRAVSRRHAAYVARAVLPTDEAIAPLDAAQIADAFATTTLTRLADLRILGGRNRKGRASFRRWLGA